ncbi:Rossmann-fold NAD(P)-binding domain-containing protein [Sandaracinobacteroides saxicola]|uniref:Oxidoreductase n=1 Tax=Sandaracinobacteroides saxicola TaxID=2759707 RepID=A0A7G5ILL1_9SPHN|nr:oxidoreductase [Sandaracinobacteroides saxicola]QMW24253.1 oxidoreductase [Sandaracinobacteroides saxicola]
MIALAGASGLTGGLVAARLPQLLRVGRREGDDIVVDLTRVVPELPALAVAVCALGTTMAKAGSDAAFRAVDETAVLNFARAARAAGAGRFVLVSSVGAGGGGFYLRVKGEVERAVAALGFARLDVMRPGLLLGPRAERRPGERLAQAVAPWLNPLMQGPLEKYGALPAAVLADAIVALLRQAGPAPGVFVHENGAMRALAKGV